MTGYAPGRASTKLVAQLVAFVVSRGTLLAATVLTARVAGVEEYGGFAMALVIFQAGLLLRDAGLGHALIVLRRESIELTWPAFVGTAAVGIGFAVLMAGLSDAVASFVGLPQSSDEMRILALAFGIGSLGVASNASLEQQLRFRARALIDVAAFATLGIVSLALLAAGFGVMALAWGYVGHGLIQSAAALALTPPWRYRRAGMPGAGSLYRYGGMLWIGALLTYLSTNADNALVGRLGGAAALGMYALAYTVGNTVTISLAQVLNRVALPYYARAAGGRRAMAEAVRAVVPLAVSAGMVPAIAVIVMAPEIRTFVIGDLSDLVPIVALAAYGVVRSLGMSLGTILNATRRAKVATLFSGVNVAIMLALIVPAHGAAGVSGVAVAVLLAMIISTALLVGAVEDVRRDLRFLILPTVAVAALSLMVLVPSDPVPFALRIGAGVLLAGAFIWRGLAVLRGAFWQGAGRIAV